jgi:hypothetical protein
MPPSAGLPRFDHRADVTGMGLVALALILGRPLQTDEFPHRIPALLSDARERSALGQEEPLSTPLRAWLARALQVDVRRAFASAPEAMGAFEELIADEETYVASPVALETFLSRYGDSLLEGPPPPRAQPIDASLASWHAALDAPAPPRSQAVVPHAVVPHAVVPHPSQISSFESFDPPALLNRPAASFRIDDLAVATPFEQIPVESWEDRLDTWEDEKEELPAPPVPGRSVPPIHDITDLLGPEPLPGLESLGEYRAGSARPLFDPETPFTAEADSPPAPPARPRSRLILVGAILVALAGGVFMFGPFGSSSGSPAMGALAVQSNPAGVQVFVDGIEKGRTPTRVTLPPGSHILELRGRGVPRVIPLTITAGAEVSQYLEFAEAPVTGQLAVQSQPAGAKVLVDGVERGLAPLTVRDLAPGDHLVELQSAGGHARHTVNVEAGGTASLLIPIGSAAAAGPVSGWVSVKAPFTMEILEAGRVLGSSETDRIMMAAGRHELELVSETLGYRATRVVQVLPGKVVAIAVDLPQGVVNLNASPWAEVWIDGQRVGDTPIGNLNVAIGPHEIVFKHPELGEKRQAVSVTVGAPIRLSVDMK